MADLDETHDPARRSWVETANSSDTDFPIQNLPFGIFRRRGSGETPRGGVAIGGMIVDLAGAQRMGLLQGVAAEAAAAAGEATLNRLMEMGRAPRAALRLALSRLLAAGGAGEGERRNAVAPLLLPMAEAELLLPAAIGDFSDFYVGIYHAINGGRIYRPHAPLMPNYKWMPVGYHGRASSIIASGQPVRRPNGQAKGQHEAVPRYGPTRMLDFELELGIFVGPGNRLGQPIPIGEAAEHIFGFCLVNDWSARDMQPWETAPLGPFLAKSFATTISPWVVTPEALAPFRIPAFPRPEGDPAPLPYLANAEDQRAGGIAVALEALLLTARMGAENAAPFRLTRSDFRHAYWTAAQLVAHHSSNGCDLRPGDLLGSGTISGPEPGSQASLLEITRRGQEPLTLPNGEVRTFLDDGDEITLRARCARAGFASIGFGAASGVVLPGPVALSR